MDLELRPYQLDAFAQAREAIRSGARSILINAPTGSGKTLLASAMMERTSKKKTRATFVVDRLSLIDQTSSMFTRYGLEHGVIQASHPNWQPDLNIQVCSVQTLARRNWPDSQLDVFDECFPAGTFVSTPRGRVRIDQIKSGDWALNATGVGRVGGIVKKTAHRLVRMELDNGQRIVCTPDHPIFTDEGWTPAERLGVGALLYRCEDVHRLWSNAPTEVVLESADGNNAPGKREGIQRAHVLQQILREEAEEPHALVSLAHGDGEDPEATWSSANAAWRQWEASAGGSETCAHDARVAMASGVCGENDAQAGGRLPTSLQDRRSPSDDEDCAGTGWPVARLSQAPTTGCEEGRLTAQPRVARVEIEEHPGGIAVFNLRVRGHPSYFAEGLLVHNCHILHKAHRARLEQKQSIVVGLTATPFTKGLGKWFDAVINVTTTRQLIEEGWLSPYRIFSCAEPDMRGVEIKSTGEWDEKQASERAMNVVGEVVTEYMAHAAGRKFICSAVDTTHVQELARQFLSAGINVATYTYKDADADRQDTLTEFRKSDSTIRGLITVTAASRGFDQPDVSCIIMARPLRKSMAEHIQLFGRGLRISEGKTDCIVLDHCIASGQRVLTDRGLVPIESITLADRLWDGQEFVNHKGVISRGRKGLIRYAGLTATPDHPVKTEAGWRTLGQCAEEQASIITTGVGGTALRERNHHLTRGHLVGGARKALHACALRVRHLWLPIHHFVEQLARFTDKRLQTMQSAAPVPQVVVWPGAANATPVSGSEKPSLEGLRRQGDRVPFRVSDFLRTVDTGQPRNPIGCGAPSLGSHRQQRSLRSRQSSVGNTNSERLEHATVEVGQGDAPVQIGIPGSSLRRYLLARIFGSWNVVFRHRGSMAPPVEEAEGEVWDVLDCGPRNSFTCEGLLVHNSGNAARFYLDTESFFDDGIDALDAHKSKTRELENEREPKFIKCPSCGCLHTARPVCPECGHEYPKKKAIAHVPGTLTELISGGYQRELARDVWPMIVHYALTRKQGDAARKQALAIYRSLVGQWPKTDFYETAPKPPTHEMMNLIRYQNIRWAKGTKR